MTRLQHDINCSILSNTESMVSTLLLIIIYIFVGIKIMVACSARICKQTITTVSKEMLQVINFHSKNTVPYVSMK